MAFIFLEFENKSVTSEDTSTLSYASGVLARLLSLVGHMTFIFLEFENKSVTSEDTSTLSYASGVLARLLSLVGHGPLSFIPINMVIIPF